MRQGWAGYRKALRGGRGRGMLGWALLSLLAVMSFPAQAETVVVGDVMVTAEPVPGGNSRHGYCEFRFTIANGSREQTREVLIELGGTGFGSSQLESITRTVRVGPDANARVSLLQPGLALAGNRFRVRVGALSKRGTLPLVGQHGVERYYHGRGALDIADVLISRDLNADDFRKRVETVLEEVSGSSYHHGVAAASAGKYGAYSLFRAETDVRDWSDNWLGYTRYDGVMLSGRDVTEMKEETQEALRRYVMAGGSVLVMGGSFVPDGAPEASAWESSATKRSHFGFGEIVAVAGSGWSTLSDDGIRGLMKMWSRSRKPWVNPKSLVEVHKVFPVTEGLRVPTRGFFMIMLIYSILIGPVTIGVLAKFNRRAWLLWIVPAASLGTCVLVALHSLFSEGVRPTVRLGGLTLLDETRHEAATIGLSGFYCPLTPSEGVRLDDSTEVTPLMPRSWRTDSSPRTVDWTQGQHLKSGWLRARVPSYFMVRRYSVQRERLECRRVDAGFEVMNGFGCNIEHLRLVGHDGTVYVTDDLGAGDKRVLTARENEKIEFRSEALREAFSYEWTKLDDYVRRRGRRLLGPGMYLATLEGAPFLEKGLSGDPHEKLSQYVVGVMASRDEREAQP